MARAQDITILFKKVFVTLVFAAPFYSLFCSWRIIFLLLTFYLPFLRLKNFQIRAHLEH